MGEGGGIFGSPLGKASGPENQSMGFADELSKMARNYWEQTKPLRNEVIDRSTDFMQGDLDVTGTPMYAAGKGALEDQYGVAREQALADMPAGGPLQEGLTGLSGDRASSLAGLVSQLAQDEYNKAYGTAMMSPQTSMGGMAGAGGVMSPVLGSQASKQGAAMGAIGNICCFIFICGYGSLHPIVRRYRELKMNRRNRRGYYWLSDRLVPWMEKSRAVKALVNLCMVKPMVSYGKHYFNLNKIGVVFTPITAFWLLFYSVLGHRPPYRRKGTVEVV